MNNIRKVPESYRTAICCYTCAYAQRVQRFMEMTEYYCNFSGEAPEIPGENIKYPHPSVIARSQFESYNFVSANGICDNHVTAEKL